MKDVHLLGCKVRFTCKQTMSDQSKSAHHLENSVSAAPQGDLGGAVTVLPYFLHPSADVLQLAPHESIRSSVASPPHAQCPTRNE